MPRLSDAKRHTGESRYPVQLSIWLVILSLTLSGCGLLKRVDGVPEPVPSEKPGTPAAKPKPGAKPKPAVPLKPVDKGDPQARFDQGLELMKANQVTEAEDAFKSLTVDFPEFAGPWTDLGILYAKSKRTELALMAFNKAITLNSKNAIAYNWLGIIYREGRDYTRAEKAYQFALKANPDEGLAHLNLGILYDEYLKRPQEALTHFREYQKLGGKDDLRVAVWIAEIEKTSAPAAAPAASTASPAPARPVEPKR